MVTFWVKWGQLIVRLNTFGMATMSVINGSAYGGGVFKALQHDYVLMNGGLKKGKPFKLWLNENDMGFQIPESMVRLCQHKCKPRGYHQLMLGTMISATKAKELGIVNAIYKDQDDLQAQIQAFAQELGPKAADSETMSKNKFQANKKFLPAMDLYVNSMYPKL